MKGHDSDAIRVQVVAAFRARPVDGVDHAWLGQRGDAAGRAGNGCDLIGPAPNGGLAAGQQGRVGGATDGNALGRNRSASTRSRRPFRQPTPRWSRNHRPRAVLIVAGPFEQAQALLQSEAVARGQAC